MRGVVMATTGLRCGICGGTGFRHQPVLWDRLITEWQLSPDEAGYIDRQQGESCLQCGSNLRSIALANALRAYLGTTELLRVAAASPVFRDLSVLEINEAGHLTPVLRSFTRYVYGAYPQVDIHALPYADGAFDVVIHSDTLEHVKNPVHALTECRRVLKRDGALCFTVPIVVGRMSRSREGLPNSFHGNAAVLAEDWAVRTEFGADAWTFLMQAGFNEVSIHAVGYPAGIAMLARADST
jgi:SAM-dependent methyltransferase